MKQKILLIASNGLGKSGVPTIFMEIVRGLHSSFDFDIVVDRDDDYFKKEFLSYGGNIYKLSLKKTGLKFLRIIKNKIIINNFFVKIAKHNNYSIVHSFKESNSFLYLKAAKKIQVQKRIIEISRQLEHPKNVINKFLQSIKVKKSIKFANEFVSVSLSCGEMFFKNHYFTVIKNTFDSSYYKFKENKGKKLEIVQVGSILPIKNQLFSLKTINILKSFHNDIKLTFLGKQFDKNYMKKLNNFIQINKLETNVIFRDETYDQKEIYSTCSVSLMPSLAEGFGLTAVESQALGIKTFVSQNVPKEIDIGNCTFLPLDPKLWAKEIDLHYRKNGNQRKRSNPNLLSKDLFLNNYKKLYLN